MTASLFYLSYLLTSQVIGRQFSQANTTVGVILSMPQVKLIIYLTFYEKPCHWKATMDMEGQEDTNYTSYIHTTKTYRTNRPVITKNLRLPELITAVKPVG